MAKPADIQDPAFRSALEEAERLLDDGQYMQAGRLCAETYLRLLEQRPELLPPADLPDLQPIQPQGQRRVADDNAGLARLDSARAFRRTWWPGTGAISVVVGPDRVPSLQYAKDRISLAEATGYFEFLLEQLAHVQRSAAS
jgi:hypothetical protein